MSPVRRATSSSLSSRSDKSLISEAACGRSIPKRRRRTPTTKCSNQPIATLPAFGRLSLLLWRQFAPISPGGTL
jgi:hypothetical protein